MSCMWHLVMVLQLSKFSPSGFFHPATLAHPGQSSPEHYRVQQEDSKQTLCAKRKLVAGLWCVHCFFTYHSFSKGKGLVRRGTTLVLWKLELAPPSVTSGMVDGTVT